MNLVETYRGNKLTTGVDTITLEPLTEIIEHDFSGRAGSNISNYKELKRALRTSEALKIIYILPVQTIPTPSFGDGITEVKEIIDSGVINDNIVFIQPTFTVTPWYANHPTNQSIQQEVDMIDFFDYINLKYGVFPQIETYLLGYSKSGYGAMLLALKHPNYVNGVLVWDAPLGLNSFITTDMSQVFGTLENLQDNYQLNDILTTNNSNLVGKDILIGGYNLWETLSVNFINDLTNYTSINYTHNENLDYPHKWNDAWILQMLDFLDDVIT